MNTDTRAGPLFVSSWSLTPEVISTLEISGREAAGASPL
jgi:hypothetical protein